MRFATLIGPELKDLLRENPAALSEVLEELHPEDIAEIVDDLSEEEAATLLAHVPAEIAAPVFERMSRERQEEIITRMSPEVAADIVESMSSDDRADLVQDLDDEPREKIMAALEPEEARDIRALSEFAENTAGGLMTTDFIGLSKDLTIRETIEAVRARADSVETVYYIYVLHGVDDELPASTPEHANESARAAHALHHDGPYKLLGVASLRDLLLAESTQTLGDVMTENVITLAPDLHQEEVAKTLAKYDLSAVPVTDKFGRLLGVVTFDDVMDVLVAEQTEDVQKLAGIEPVEGGYFATGFWRFISARARWLIALFIGEFFTGTALARYEGSFHAVATLVMFIPLVISSGGNSGSQSATIVIRAMAVGDIKDKDTVRVVRRELGQGMILGLILGSIGFVRTMLWRPVVAHQFRLSCVVSLTLVAVVTLGCAVGALFPMLLKRMRFDPAVSSTPFIASLVDVLGIITYFSIAKFFLASVMTPAH
ncbi:MAG: magnesium transporter [Deltaproteobacteria bacterium]|nr:magnesium transporter [Deltaproteobacteria bacterium]